VNPLEKKIIFIFLDRKKSSKTCCFFNNDDPIIVRCASKTFDDFFHETFLVSAQKINQTFKKSKKKYAVIQKKEDFLLFSFTPIQQS